MKFVTYILMELFIRGFWEAALFLFGALTIANVKIPVKKFIVSSIIFAFLALAIRQLPISYGIHTMLILVILNLMIFICFHVNLEDAIKSSIVITVILFALEGLNELGVLLFISKDQFSKIMQDDFLKLIYFIPSTVMFLIADLVLYKVLKKKREKKEHASEAELKNS